MKLRCGNILITGGTGGIGKAIAKRLLEVGANVVITGRHREKLEKTKEEIEAETTSGQLYFMEWDIGELSICRDNIRKAAALMNGLDGLVNNAAVGTSQVTGRGYEPWDITSEEWDIVMDTNLKAAFFMMRNMVDYMLENEIRGNILNIASNAACMDIIGSYGSSKLSLLKMTRAFGKRFGHNGIIINGIAPGATISPMISYYAKEVDQPYTRHAIERFIRPEEIAELAHYLMSDFGEIICGHTVVADGGDNAATL